MLPEFREYERLSTTVVNAAVGPRMLRYLDRFLERVKALGIGVEPVTVHSNGGLMSIGTVRSFPVTPACPVRRPASSARPRSGARPGSPTS